MQGARLVADLEASDQPIVFATDSHRPPPSEFTSIFTQLARRDERFQAMWYALAAATSEMQVFDFGLIDDNKLVTEASRGLAFYGKDFLRMPFRSCLFWYDTVLDPQRLHDGAAQMAVRGDTESLRQRAREIVAGGKQSLTQRYATIAIDADAWGLSGNTRTIMACDWLDMDSDPELQAVRHEITSMTTRKAFLLSVSGYFKVEPNSTDHCYGSVAYASAGRAFHADAMGSLGDGVVGLSMMIATKGIPLRVEDPSVKLNAKRIRNGKVPLVRVTHVNTARYYEALTNTERGGHHASPVPHLRRGHIRHFRSKRFKNAAGTEKWIPDMIVNCQSIEEALAHRSHYEVES